MPNQQQIKGFWRHRRKQKAGTHTHTHTHKMRYKVQLFLTKRCKCGSKLASRQTRKGEVKSGDDDDDASHENTLEQLKLKPGSSSTKP